MNPAILARNFIQAAWRSYRMAFVVLAVGILLSIFAPHFLRTDNILNVLTNASVVAIVGLGMTLAIASGNFDLSVGATAAFASVVSLSMVPHYGVFLSILIGLVVGAIVGFCNGIIITELRVPAFIATLGTLTIVRGLSLIYTKGQDITLFGDTGYKVLSGGHLLGIPAPIIMVLALAVVLAAVVKYTPFGRHTLAIGSNAAAARKAGVRVNPVLWGVFAIVGATAALTGMIVSAQVLTANGRLDTGLELQAIAVVVIGGTSLAGGQATLVGTLLGSILITMINNGLNLLNVPDSYQLLTVGVLLLLAVALEVSRGLDLRKLLRAGTSA
jgi:ribose/xylose/arabinose/galactoside ABC-type transport system permease subunit